MYSIAYQASPHFIFVKTCAKARFYAILADLSAKIQLFLHMSKKNSNFVAFLNPHINLWKRNNA